MSKIRIQGQYCYLKNGVSEFYIKLLEFKDSFCFWQILRFFCLFCFDDPMVFEIYERFKVHIFLHIQGSGIF